MSMESTIDIMERFMWNQKQEIGFVKDHEKNFDQSMKAVQAKFNSSLMPADGVEINWEKTKDELDQTIKSIIDSHQNFNTALLYWMHDFEAAMYYWLQMLKKDLNRHQNCDFMFLQNFIQNIWQADEGVQFAYSH